MLNKLFSSNAYWILKSEPKAFGIDDLAQCNLQTEPWNGVRNYQARNFIRQMKKGELAFFYHSNCKVPGIVGIVEIVKEAYPDETTFDPHSRYFDAKSTLENPRWYCVDVKLIQKFTYTLSLSVLRTHPILHDMLILRQGNRLSVTPITQTHWEIILGYIKGSVLQSDIHLFKTRPVLLPL